MALTKDTTKFFVKGSASQFTYVLSLYPQALKVKAENKTKKPEELIKLDNWYQNELPKMIKSRGKDAHLIHEELVQLMKWKQTRGKAYPQVNYLIKVNTPRAVIAETKKAFKKLPNIEQAMTALINLKGVGTTMASALLAAAAPDAAPFMADECMMAIPGIDGFDYTVKEYLKFVQYIQTAAERLNQENPSTEWNAHQVELALWTHSVAAELAPELLATIPETNGKAVHQNGDAEKIANNESDDGDNSREQPTVDSAEDSRGQPESEAPTADEQDSAGSNATHDSRRAEDDDSADAPGGTDEDTRAEPPSKKLRTDE